MQIKLNQTNLQLPQSFMTSIGRQKFPGNTLSSYTTYLIGMKMKVAIFLSLWIINTLCYSQPFGLTGTYYKGNAQHQVLFVRNDAKIAFLAGEIKDPEGARLTDFNVSWEGKIVPKYTETYQFVIHAIQYAELKINGNLILSGWEAHASIDLVADSAYDVQFSLSQSQRDDYTALLMWKSASQIFQVVPEEAFRPADISAPYHPAISYTTSGNNGLKQEIFTNASYTNRISSKVVPNIRILPGELNDLRNMYGEKLYIRWIGRIVPPHTLKYKLAVWAVYNSTLIVDGKTLGNGWEYHAELDFEAGKEYDIEFRVETRENEDASARLFWESDTLLHEIIQPEYFRPVQGGLTGQYFANSDFTELKIVRNDSRISLLPGELKSIDSLGLDNFAVRWMGKIAPRYSENYQFQCLHNQSMRVVINEQTICDETNNTGEISLIANQDYDIQIEYANNSGIQDYWAVLSWSSVSQKVEVVPSNAYKITDTLAYKAYPTIHQLSGQRGLYTEFSETDNSLPVIRIDPTIQYFPGEFDWIEDFNGVHLDVKWRGRLNVITGDTYTFTFITNGNATLSINNQLVITQEESSGQLTLETGEIYDIEVNYSTNDKSDAHLFLCWESNSLKKQIIPVTYLYQPIQTNISDLYSDEIKIQSYPNPFGVKTTVEYRVAETSNVTISVYDMTGKKIKELVNGKQTPGDYTICWLGDDDKNNPVQNGIYLFKVSIGQQIKSLAVIKNL